MPQSFEKEKLIDCNSFNSSPGLWYLKSGDTIGYYVYIPAKEFNHTKYVIGSSQIEDEKKFNLTQNEKILRHGKFCSFGRTKGQNINYLYCKKFQYISTELSDSGEILSKPTIKISTIFYFDKNIKLQETQGGYLPLENAKLISQKCEIIFNK